MSASLDTEPAPFAVQEVRAINLVSYAKANLHDAERNVELARLALAGAESALEAIRAEQDARNTQRL